VQGKDKARQSDHAPSEILFPSEFFSIFWGVCLQLSRYITANIDIPPRYRAGKFCDGQVLLLSDVTGFTQGLS
jgi:hypothetical protein